MSSKPNILVICSDQHNPAITGCYGNDIIETPNLDRLAREGVVYENCYCNQPLCVPSRMSFMTGKYPSRIGVLGNGSVLDSRIPTYAHMLAGIGYRTVLSGRMHFVGPDQFHGFQERIGSDYTAYAFHCAKVNRYNPLKGLLGNGGRPDPLLEVGQGSTCTQRMDKDTTAAAKSWIQAYGEADCDEPFMMTVGYFAPHCPYIAEEQYYKKYLDRVIPADTAADELAVLHSYHKQYRKNIEIESIPGENLRKATAAYYGLVDLLDNEIGKLLETLEQTGLSENTIILYFSDHGEMLGEHGRWHKQTFYEGSSRIPLIIRVPESLGGEYLRPGNRVTTPVSLVDIFPTICEMTGRDVPFEVDGKSLLYPSKSERPVFVEYHDSFGSHRMIRKGRWKLNYYSSFETFELFDLEEDPKERNNLSGNPRYAGVEASLRDGLFADGWSGGIKAEQDKYLESIGFAEASRIGTSTQQLIESGVIVEVPGYDVNVSWYENRLDD